MTFSTKEKLALREAIHAMKWLDKHHNGWGLEDECAILENICNNYKEKEIQSNHNFDLERARGLRDFLQDDCAEVGDVWAEMIAEIERLRGEMENYGDDYVCQMKSKDARIQELEDALVEERARALWFEGDDPCDPPNLDWKTEPNDIPESVRLLWGESARRQLQAEGKIGPDADAKPHCWQITEERKAALKDAIAMLTEAEELIFESDINVLRTMLGEVMGIYSVV